MKVEFIPYKQALALKELGFDEPCFGRWLYDDGKYIIQYFKPQLPEIQHRDVYAPLYQQIFRWFREKYSLFSTITYLQEYKYCFDIGAIPECNYQGYGQNFNTYEEAEIACLNKLIEIVKQ